MAIRKNIPFEYWSSPEESSDSPSDSQAGHTEKDTGVSLHSIMLSDDEHKARTLKELESIRERAAAAREEMKDSKDKENLFMNLNRRNKYIPYGAVVTLQRCAGTDCRVEYNGTKRSTKRGFLRKLF